MYLKLKRALDSLVAVLLLFLLFPVVVVVGMAVFFFDGRPVFFLQVRPGFAERPFLLAKFRTMSRSSESASVDESARVTKLGAFLRRTSLDELPSLWNVMKGDLSFVGPRPLLMDYLGVYSSRHSLRHAVRPGLTGLAQVSGRNLLSWKERLDLDIVYVQRQSFWLDVKILLKTIVVIMSRRGVNQADGRTMTRMTGPYDPD